MRSLHLRLRLLVQLVGAYLLQIGLPVEKNRRRVVVR
jgi:hypothetical protein